MIDVPSMPEAMLDEMIVESISGSVTSRDLLWAAVERAESVAVANKHLAEAATQRRNHAEAEAARVKERIQFHLQARNLKELKASYGCFRRQANGGHQPLRITRGASELPPEFQRVTVACDLEKVRAALKEGEILDWVEVLDRGEHLRLA